MNSVLMMSLPVLCVIEISLKECEKGLQGTVKQLMRLIKKKKG